MSQSSHAPVQTNDIVYFRARVCGRETFEMAGRDCVLVEPVDKQGNAMKTGGWVFGIPVEWLIPVEEMRAKIRRSRDVQSAD